MRHRWYADNRDLIKWSVLLLLARRSKADRIIQIALLNPSEFPDVEIDGERHSIPEEVLRHFREVKNVTTLSHRPRISVFDRDFRDRGRYFAAAARYLSSFHGERCVVFLDPDTGLEPNGGGDAKHVMNRELQDLWKELPSGWLLVFYQHETNRAGKPWIDDKRAQFARAIGVPSDKVGVASAKEIAKDVVFFHAPKP